MTKLEQPSRNCSSCKHSDNGKCAYTEECHECMWDNKYDQQPCEDCISREQTLKAFAEKCGGECACCEYNGSGYDTAENCKLIKSMPSVTSQQIRWIPVSERAADFPCLACDIFKQIFIPSGIVVLNNRCYDGKDFDFNVEKFLKGKEITTYGGEKLYVKPREITAWMPLPEPYQSND